MAKILITTKVNSNEHTVSITVYDNKDAQSRCYNFNADPNHPKEYKEQSAENFFRMIESFLFNNGCGALKLRVIFSEDFSIFKKVIKKLKEIDFEEGQ